jgi:shikimate kinase
LNTPMDTLKKRVMNSKKRPLAQDSVKFEALYKERIPLYRLAHITVDHPGLESEEVCELVLKRILTHENS